MILAAGFGQSGNALALSAGVIAAFNPCGFAMLPAYVSYFVGTSDHTPDLSTRIVRAATVATLVTLGFVSVFGLIGLAFTPFLSQINSVVPFISIVVGIVLALVGIAMVRGYELKVSLPKASTAPSGNSVKSMYLYGVSYAIVSLSCGFGGFTTAVVSAFKEKSVLSSLSVYVSFALGMGLVLTVLSFAVAFAQQAFVRGMRRVLPYVNRASGILMIVGGLYVAYYGWFSWRVVQLNKSAPQGPVAWVERWSGIANRWVDRQSTSTIVASIVTLVMITFVAVVFSRTKPKVPGNVAHAYPVETPPVPSDSPQPAQP